MIKNKLINNNNNNIIIGYGKKYYSTLLKKKILISGNDTVGLSLALFLKKKGISCDIVESGSKNDVGLILSEKNLDVYKKYAGQEFVEKIIENGVSLNGNGYFARDGEGYGLLNFSKYFKSHTNTTPILLSTTESKLKEILINECIKININKSNNTATTTTTEGNVTFKKNIKIKKINESQQQQDQQSNSGSGAFITFSNSTIKNHYDLIIGTGNSYEVIDPVREYLSTSIVNSENNKKQSIYTQPIKTTYYFNTITNNNFSLIPPLLITQFQKQKKLVSFLLPNKKIALSGTFTRDFAITTESDKFNQLVSSEYKNFEDINAHNIVSLSDNQTELTLCKVEPFQFTKFVHNSMVLIGDAADRLPQDNLFTTSIGIEDANKLVELFDNNNKDTTNTTTTTIPNLLNKFNDDRILRLKNFMKSVSNDQNLIFGSDIMATIFGKYYLKFYYNGRRQYNRFKNLLINNN